MGKPQNNYFAYVIRLRRGSASSRWQISLQDIHNGSHLQFVDIYTLLDFFQVQFGSDLSPRNTSQYSDDMSKKG